MSEDVIIVTSSLIKEMNNKNYFLRVNEIQVLCKILVDVKKNFLKLKLIKNKIKVLIQGNRYLKQSNC